MPKTRHIPVRTCISCRIKTNKRDMLRIISAPDGSAAVDVGGRMNGRGAYICGRCRHSPGKLSRGRIEYALRTKMDDEKWTALLESVPKDDAG